MTAGTASRRDDGSSGLGTGRITWPPAASPFLALGTAAVVVGGLVAAVTRPFGWEHGAWAAAYLVLVVGVGQMALGAGQALFAAVAVRRRLVVAEIVLWNGGSVGVLAGTAADAPVAVTIGGSLLLVALGLFASVRASADAARRWPRRAHLAVLVVLLVSTPIGLVLAWLGR